MSQVKHFFGFGSLINTESLLATVPDASDIKPCYIQGFKRSFNLWDPIGWSETNLDLAGVPFCALDVARDSDPGTKVNGVVFTIGERNLARLLEREREYDLIETIAYDFYNGDPIGVCSLFSADKNNGSYDFKSDAQTRYLQICLESAKQYGEKFFDDFADTTFINGKKLREIPELLEA